MSDPLAYRSYDVAILGGGPAAIALARRLADLGLKALVMTRPRQPATVEGFSPRTLEVCARFLGMADHLSTLEPVVRQAHWNGQGAMANREAIIDRRSFDAAMLAAVRAAGIDVIEARARSVERRDGYWQIRFDPVEGTARTVAAPFLVEARGRAAPLARSGSGRGPAMVSLSRRVSQQQTRPAGPPAAVASFSDGWAWFIRAPAARLDDDGGEGVLQIFVDGEAVPRRPDLGAYYDRCLATTPEAEDWLAGSILGREVTARHAGMVLSGDLAGPDHLRVGDAAMAIDPLSGHGVYKALSGALAAAPVINTLIRRAQDRDLAIGFYETRLRDDFDVSARLARDFYRMEQRWSDRPFWRARQDWPDDLPPHPDIVPGAVRIARAPVSVDNFIEERDVLITPDQPRGVFHLGGVPAVEAWRAYADGARTTEALTSRLGTNSRAAQAALQWFDERGLGQ